MPEGRVAHALPETAEDFGGEDLRAEVPGKPGKARSERYGDSNGIPVLCAHIFTYLQETLLCRVSIWKFGSLVDGRGEIYHCDELIAIVLEPSDTTFSSYELKHLFLPKIGNSNPI